MEVWKEIDGYRKQNSNNPITRKRVVLSKTGQ